MGFFGNRRRGARSHRNAHFATSTGNRRRSQTPSLEFQELGFAANLNLTDFLKSLSRMRYFQIRFHVSISISRARYTIPGMEMKNNPCQIAFVNGM